MGKSMLFSPITIGSHTFKNRVFMSPMCMYVSNNKDGLLTDARINHYLARAAGGVGAIVVEATAVREKGGITDKDLGLFNDAQEKDFARLVKAVHAYDCKIGVQLGHAGRKGLSWDEVVSSSAINFDESAPEYKKPRALETAEVKEIIADFGKAAGRAQRAGLDFVEIHGAHGYLVSQFISPLINQRNDEYGGSLENRYRFLGEIIEAMKANAPGLDLHLRISADEIEEGGNTFEEISQMLKWAQEAGVVFFDISSGGLTPKPPKIFPGYQALLARKLKAQGLPCGAVGLLKEADLAEYVLQAGDADVIYLGRPLLENPQWCYAAAKKLHDEIPYAIPVYFRGF